MTVAQWRRLRSVVEPPSFLITFDPAEWAEPGDASWQPFDRWKVARHRWVRAHGNDSILGNLVDAMREEHNLHLERIRNGAVA
jgi:hypothetical protein